MPRNITVKQERFAQEYVKTGNATEAYRRAYNVTSINSNTLMVNASKILNSTKVLQRVSELQAKSTDACIMSVADVVRELKVNAELGRQLEDVRASNEAYALIGKHLNMFIERVEHTGKDGGPLQMDLRALVVSKLERLELKDPDAPITP